MKRFALATIATLAASTAAFAGASVGALDTNGDNFVSAAELTVAYPGIGSSDFRALDVNDDRRLSSVELTAPGASAILGKNVSGTSAAVTIGDVDSNGDGFARLSELAAAVPGLTLSDFHEIDANRDNRVSAREILTLNAQTVLGRYADTPDFVGLTALDTNDDHFAAFDELAAAYPGLSQSDFQTIDVNDDRRVSANELNSSNSVGILGKYR